MMDACRRPAVAAVLALVLTLAACLGARSTGDGDPATDGTPAAPADEPSSDEEPAPDDDPAALDDDPAADDGAVVDGEYVPPDEVEPPPELFLLGIGDPCVASAECESGACALPCGGFGVCVAGSCASDGDCVVPGSEDTHCCVDGACSYVLGAACGDRSGGQGAPCGGGGQTDCAEGLRCLDECMVGSFCATACATDSECQALDPDLGCFKVVGGDERCVPDPEAPYLCDSDVECGPGGVCTLSVSYDGTEVVTLCKQAAGPLVVGAMCQSGMECQSGFCFDSFCSGSCSTDADCACDPGTGCAGDLVCLDVWFSLGGGHVDAVPACYPRMRCDSTADCYSLVCAAWPEEDGWAKVCENPGVGEGPAGMSCDSNAQCQSGVCHDGECRDLCGDDSHCGAGESCVPTEVEGGAVPGAKLAICSSG